MKKKTLFDMLMFEFNQVSNKIDMIKANNDCTIEQDEYNNFMIEILQDNLEKISNKIYKNENTNKKIQFIIT